MVTLKDYENGETAWCPGCGNFGILQAVKKALVKVGLEPYQVLMVSGIGQAAKLPHYMKCNLFNGLHGRTLPVATGAKIVANLDGLTAKDLVKIATTLRKSIEYLGTNTMKAMELAKQIDEIEGQVDDKYLKSKAMLLEHSKETDAATILLIKDLIEEMEHVADACDDTADYVRILTVTREAP